MWRSADRFWPRLDSREESDQTGSRLEVPYHFPMLPEARPKAEILQQQWLHHLNIRVKLVAREFNVHWRMVLEGDYHGCRRFCCLAALSGSERLSRPVRQRCEWQSIGLV